VTVSVLELLSLEKKSRFIRHSEIRDEMKRTGHVFVGGDIPKGKLRSCVNTPYDLDYTIIIKGKLILTDTFFIIRCNRG
jgi:hypothetical protein